MKTQYMLGNLVRYNGEVVRIIKLYNTSDVTLAEVKCPDDIELLVLTTELKGISLDDDFFKKNDYEISKEYKTNFSVNERMQHITAKDGFGPAVTKYIHGIDNRVEYCITGIIITTVDDFQNLMNVCQCEDIAKKVKV